MFGFLKEKLKGAISKFSKKADEEAKEVVEEPKVEKKAEKPKPSPKKEKSKPKPKPKLETREDKKEEEILEQEKEIIEEEKKLEETPKLEKAPVEEEVEEAAKEEEEKVLENERIELEKEAELVEEKKEKKGFLGLFKKKEIPQEEKELEAEPEVKEEPKEEVKEEVQPEQEKKGFFGKVAQGITTKKIDEKQFEEFFWDLELALLENNVAVEVIEKIKDDLKENLVNKPIPRTKIENTISTTLNNSLKEILEVEKINFLDKVKTKKPYVICFIGINGSGKTTSIAKVAKLLQNNDLTCVMAAADTFRAAAIDQIQHHADKLGIKLIKQDYGADPAAVAFDAIKHAEAKNIDVVLIDTAGRMHSNENLQDEMKKIIRVAKPDLKIFVGESITGNDCVEQAKKFNDSVEIDGIILSKADIDEKGGAALSVSYVTKKPIIYIGTGQEYEDIKEFSPEVVLDNLGL